MRDTVPDIFLDMADVAVDMVDEADYSYVLEGTGYNTNARVEYHIIDDRDKLIRAVAIKMYKKYKTKR